MSVKDEIMAEINALLDEQMIAFKRGMTPDEAFSYTQRTARIRELFESLRQEYLKDS
jgi:hypothetical protein